jgi:uncharacterized integral membrane protein
MEDSRLDSQGHPAPDEPRADRRATRRTRTSAAWTATVAGTVLLLVLLIFILENTQSVKINFLGAHGRVALGIALLLSAVAGALIVATIGAARMAQLRRHARRAERSAT